MIKVIENLFTMIKRRENDKLLENEVEGIMEIEDYIKLSEEEVKKYTYTIPVPQMFKYKGKVYRAYDKYYEEQVLSTLRTFRCAYFGEKKWNKMERCKEDLNKTPTKASIYFFEWENDYRVFLLQLYSYMVDGKMKPNMELIKE